MFHSGRTRIGEAGQLPDYIRISEEGWQRDLSKYFTDEYLMNASEPEIIAQIVTRNSVAVPDLDVTSANSRRERRSFRNADKTRSDREVITVRVPCTGEPRLFRYWTGSESDEALDLVIADGFVEFSIVVETKSADIVNKEIDRVLDVLTRHAERIAAASEDYNATLPHKVRSGLLTRKTEIQKDLDFLGGLKIPIETRSPTPDVLTMPLVEQEAIDLHDAVPAQIGLDTRPYIDPNDYHSIVSFIQVMGKRFEKLPSSYRDRSETDIRDLLAILMETQFRRTDSVSVTAETFNKSGKTDILIQHQQLNVFAAECKYWNGKKGFHDAINQLLGYLTWRDGRAALIIFDQNQGLSEDLATIRREVELHTNFVAVVDDCDSSCIHCQFHLDGDKGLHIDLTVLVFHFPKI